MFVDLLNTSSDTRAPQKAIKHITRTKLTRREKPSATPIFIIRRGDYDITEVNYIYVPDWARYYFIDCIVIKSADNIELHCRMDMFAE